MRERDGVSAEQRWCGRRMMRARLDGRVMVVGRRAAAAHEVAAAGAGGQRRRAHAPGQARPAPAADAHAPLLPRGGVGLGRGRGRHSRTDPRARPAPGLCCARRRNRQAVRSGDSHASRYIIIPIDILKIFLQTYWSTFITAALVCLRGLNINWTFIYLSTCRLDTDIIMLFLYNIKNLLKNNKICTKVVLYTSEQTQSPFPQTLP